jgi:FlaA1/EpsC-like NDP-sugar epimerase
VSHEKSSLLDTILGQTAAARTFFLFLFHVGVFIACFVIANLVRYDFALPAEGIALARSGMTVVVLLQLVVGGLFGFYRGWWRYVGISDVIRLVLGLTTAAAIQNALWFAGNMFPNESRFIQMPRGVILIDWALALLTLFGARLTVRLGRDRFRPADERLARNQSRLIIVGAGDAGETLAREIEHRRQLGKVVAFVDDQRVKWGSSIRGIAVRGPISSIGDIAEELEAEEVLIAIPSASGKRLREIVRHVSAAGLQFKILPGIDHLVTGKVHITQLRPVNVEDLLRRKPIELPGDPVRELFRGKRVLVTGAGGTIGSELSSQILQFEPSRLALVERSEFALYEVRKRLTRESVSVQSPICSSLTDICDEQEMAAMIARERPQIVLHAAAHKHVPIGEENPAEYLRNNALAARRVAEMCVASGVERFVFISTDKAINPTSVMGATKRMAEVLLLDAARDSKMQLTIVRFGNVIGSSGSVIPLFMEQIAAGGPITVTHPDVTRYFIRTSEAVSLVLQAATLRENAGIFMLDMGEPVKIVELAHDLLRLSNHSEEEIPIVFTGLRPGEKLFEEIRLHGESIRPTVHPQIVISDTPQAERDLIRSVLQGTSATCSAQEAIASLERVVPEYIRDVTRPASTPQTRPAAERRASPLIVANAGLSR